jgi:HPt (histidine-containing phosphotransfer) domain-containing protein
MNAATLDAPTVQALRRLDVDGRLFPRLQAAFARTVAQHGPALQQGHDPTAQKRAAHTLRAAAAQLGAQELATHCARIEAEPGPLSPAECTALQQLLDDAQQALLALTQPSPC